MALTRDLASRFAGLTLGHLGREWPNKLDHAMAGPEDVSSPRALHPIFFGSYDWHSCVHGWWQVMRIARAFPDLPEAPAIRAAADAMLVPAMVAGELAYLARPQSAGFERPYGWAWLLALHGELATHEEERWAEALALLAHCFAERFRGYLPKLTYPVRHGAHSNTAFALVLAHGWAMRQGASLVGLIETRAREWFLNDRDARVWEPSGEDFLSPTLCEAVLMAAVLPGSEFADWFAEFLPGPGPLLEPVVVSDRTDGRIAHLDGLNLSRAWCWRRLAAVGGIDAAMAEAAAKRHLTASLPHLADDYMGEHWLATFALLALDRSPT